jgi:hypothetical protein
MKKSFGKIIGKILMKEFFQTNGKFMQLFRTIKYGFFVINFLEFPQ